MKLPPPDTEAAWRAPFTPPPAGKWDEMIPTDDLFPWNGGGVKAARTWPIAPDKGILEKRWKRLISVIAKAQEVKASRQKHTASDSDVVKAREDVRVHYVEDNEGDIHKRIREDITDVTATLDAIIDEQNESIESVPYGYRSFDRQWIIRDRRVISRPNPSFWPAHSNQQIYLKVPAMGTDGTRSRIANSPGVIVSFSEAIPDMHYLSGSRAGRVHPLWRDSQAHDPNVSPGLLTNLGNLYDQRVTASDLFAYVAAVAAHPGYTNTFRAHLPLATDLRVPVTAHAELFAQAAELGREVIRLHTYNRRFTTGDSGQTPTVPATNNPPTEAPNQKALDAAEELSHDPQTNTLFMHGTDAKGSPHRIKISNVTADMYNYTTGTMNVLGSWFKYRKASPYRRKPSPEKPASPLDDINQTQWDGSRYPEQLLELLHVLRLLTDLHTDQQTLLRKIVDGRLATSTQLRQGIKEAERRTASKPPPTYRELQQPQLPGTGEGITASPDLAR